MRKSLVIIFGLLCFQVLLGQEAGKIRVGLETGLAVPHDGFFGIVLAMEGKYNISNNMNAGVRVEVSSLWKGKSQYADINSFTVTYDYYYGKKNKIFSPFVGGGLGYYICSAAPDYDFDPESKYEGYDNPTAFVRTGFEVGKFRTYLSYNLIRNHNAGNPYNRNYDYISLNIGFYLGGGKWKR